MILEDDCLPEPTFFPFCAELLEQYQGEERIAQISGCTFREGGDPGRESYYFSRYPHCWGWATWARAWSAYDHGMAAWRDGARRRELLGRFSSGRERAYWAHAFDGAAAGRIDSWAYRWTHACWTRGWLSAVAATNLVSNIGFGAAATHTVGASNLAELPTSAMDFPLRHPPGIERDAAADASTGARCFRRPTWIQRVRRRFGRF